MMNIARPIYRFRDLFGDGTHISLSLIGRSDDQGAFEVRAPPVVQGGANWDWAIHHGYDSTFRPTTNQTMATPEQTFEGCATRWSAHSDLSMAVRPRQCGPTPSAYHSRTCVEQPHICISYTVVNSAL